MYIGNGLPPVKFIINEETRYVYLPKVFDLIVSILELDTYS